MVNSFSQKQLSFDDEDTVVLRTGLLGSLLSIPSDYTIESFIVITNRGLKATQRLYGETLLKKYSSKQTSKRTSLDVYFPFFFASPKGSIPIINIALLVSSRSGKPFGLEETDVTAQYLGYNTDHGAYYYYNPLPGKTYGETLAAVLNYTSSINIPYKWVLLDSWWYYKGYNVSKRAP